MKFLSGLLYLLFRLVMNDTQYHKNRKRMTALRSMISKWPFLKPQLMIRLLRHHYVWRNIVNIQSIGFSFSSRQTARAQNLTLFVYFSPDSGSAITVHPVTIQAWKCWHDVDMPQNYRYIILCTDLHNSARPSTALFPGEVICFTLKSFSFLIWLKPMPSLKSFRQSHCIWSSSV